MYWKGSGNIKNTIKKRIVTLSLIGAFCIPTAAYAYDGLVGHLYGSGNYHYAWAEHEHYTVEAMVRTGVDSSGWQSGWGHVRTRDVKGWQGSFGYKDSTSHQEYNF